MKEIECVIASVSKRMTTAQNCLCMWNVYFRSTSRCTIFSIYHCNYYHENTNQLRSFFNQFSDKQSTFTKLWSKRNEISSIECHFVFIVGAEVCLIIFKRFIIIILIVIRYNWLGCELISEKLKLNILHSPLFSLRKPRLSNQTT